MDACDLHESRKRVGGSMKVGDLVQHKAITHYGLGIITAQHPASKRAVKVLWTKNKYGVSTAEMIDRLEYADGNC